MCPKRAKSRSKPKSIFRCAVVNTFARFAVKSLRIFYCKTECKIAGLVPVVSQLEPANVQAMST